MTPITWTDEKRKLSELLPWEHNPRQLTEKQAKRLTDSIDEFGQVETLAIGPDNQVYNGHQRLSVLLAQHGGEYEVAVRVSSRALTYDEQRKLVIYLHEGATGEWDWDMVPNLYDVEELVDWGFPEWKIDEFMPKEEPEPKDAEPQINRAEELREQWGVELGQLWRLPSRTEGQEHRLICGDCTDAAVVGRLAGASKFDMMFTDPPYGVNYSGGIQFKKDGTAETNNREKLSGDTTDMYAQFLPVVLPHVDGPCYVWFASSVAKPLFDAATVSGCEIHAMIVWHKTNATYAAMNAQYKQRHEPLLYFKPKGSTLRWCGPTDERTVWEMPRDAVNDLHPTQKPVSLAERALRNHKADTVADLFCGSGSTIIAAENLSRQCRAVEISPGYVAVSLQRYVDAFGIEPELVS